MTQNDNDHREPNWALITLQAALGHSLSSLSARFNVSVPDIEHHLALQIEHVRGTDTFRIRSSTQIAQASNRARNDLVSFLQDAIAELLASNQPRLHQIPEFTTLVAAAAKLFAWPTVAISKGLRGYDQPPAGYTDINVSSSDSDHPSDLAPPAGPAVNLALIATTPEQLAKLAADSRSRSNPRN